MACMLNVNFVVTSPPRPSSILIITSSTPVSLDVLLYTHIPYLSISILPIEGLETMEYVKASPSLSKANNMPLAILFLFISSVVSPNNSVGI